MVSSNTAPINNPATSVHGAAATPYPSNIEVSGMTGAVTDVNVTFKGLDCSATGVDSAYPEDIDILLVGPTNVAVVVLSDVGGENQATPLQFTAIDVTLDDQAGNALPADSQLSAGTYRPVDDDNDPDEAIAGNADPFAAPAPAPTGTALSAFNGFDPNGTWSLYVVDDFAGTHNCKITGGWSIDILTGGTLPTTTTTSPATTTTTLPPTTTTTSPATTTTSPATTTSSTLPPTTTSSTTTSTQLPTTTSSSITTTTQLPTTGPAEMKILCAPFVNYGTGISYKCEAVVAATSSSGVLAAPTGSVTFSRGSTSGPTIGVCSLVPTPGTGGISTCKFWNSVQIPNGPATIYATYSGDGTYPSTTASDDVGLAKTTPHPSDTAVLCATATAPGNLKCVAVVADGDRGPDAEPLGTVNFTVGGNPVGSCTLAPIGYAGGMTECTTTTTVPVSPGSSVLATYVPGGGAPYSGSADSDTV